MMYALRGRNLFAHEGSLVGTDFCVAQFGVGGRWGGRVVWGDFELILMAPAKILSQFRTPFKEMDQQSQNRGGGMFSALGTHFC